MRTGIIPIPAAEAVDLMESNLNWQDILTTYNLDFIQERQKVISYSKNVFIPVTTLCRNRCGYCGFVEEAGQVEQQLLSPEAIIDLIKWGKQYKCTETLFVLGEQPEEKYPQVRELLRAWGFHDMLDYLCKMCEESLRIGLLPHTNAGVLEISHLRRLQEVNASMGLMLETTSERLSHKGGPHEYSPGKDPALRLQFIEEAGKLGIPFTSGILIGIGETKRERVEALLALRDLHFRYGHIQEIIIQPFCPKKGSPMEDVKEPSDHEVLKIIVVSRLIFGGQMNIQAPPNLSPRMYPLFIRAGSNDWGGISPLTKDMINPEKAWPALDELQANTRKMGCLLKERLAVYPEYVTENKKNMFPAVKRLATELTAADGYVKGE